MLPAFHSLNCYGTHCKRCCMQEEYSKNTAMKSNAVNMYRLAQSCLAKCTCRVTPCNAYARFVSRAVHIGKCAAGTCECKSRLSVTQLWGGFVGGAGPTQDKPATVVMLHCHEVCALQ